MTSRFFSILKPLIVLFFIFCFAKGVNAQTYTWEKIYRGTGFSADGGICNTGIYNNKYYYVAAYSQNKGWILKMDSRTGDTLWTKKFNLGTGSFSAMILSSDGGCIVSGKTESAMSIKVDSSGNTVWNKTYNVNDVDIKKIIKLSDNNYLICGSTGFKATLAMKIDKEGNFI